MEKQIYIKKAGGTIPSAFMRYKYRSLFCLCLSSLGCRCLDSWSLDGCLCLLSTAAAG